MYQNSKHAGNIVLLRGATLWLLVALVLAWCLVFMKLELPLIKMIFKDFHRLLQGHIDFLLMSALILGFYAAKVPLPWHVRWSMVIGAFTNSSLFLMQSMFPVLETPSEGIFSMAFRIFLMMSITITTYGFGWGGDHYFPINAWSYCFGLIVCKPMELCCGGKSCNDGA